MYLENTEWTKEVGFHVYLYSECYRKIRLFKVVDCKPESWYAQTIVDEMVNIHSETFVVTKLNKNSNQFRKKMWLDSNFQVMNIKYQ